MSRPSLEDVLARAARAYEQSDFEAARDAASVATSLDPKSVAGWHYLAAALAGLGEPGQADRAYHEALALGPDDPELLVGAADLLVSWFDDDEDALAEAVELCARGAALARKEKDDELTGDFVLLEARAFLALGKAKTALHRLDEAARLLPGDVDVALQRGIALFEVLRLDEATAAFEAVLEKEPREALAHWYLGLVAERRGDAAAATRHLEKARRLDPDAFPSPITLTEDAFAAAMEEALESLPEKVRHYLENVPVMVEPIPLDDDLLDGDPPLSPTILGVFRGAPLKDKASDDPWSQLPSSIVLYQRNLERSCRSREELLEQIEVTILHEVGHYLGLDEDELKAWGLD